MQRRDVYVAAGHISTALESAADLFMSLNPVYRGFMSSCGIFVDIPTIIVQCEPEITIEFGEELCLAHSVIAISKTKEGSMNEA